MKFHLLLSFLRKNRKNSFWITLIVYIIGLMVPEQIRETSSIFQIFIIIGVGLSFCLYNFIGWRDESRPKNKRNFSGFCFFFVLFIVLGNVIVIAFK